MSSLEAEAREDRERAAIVARYDRGHAPGAAIDAWEDPKLEIYHVTDRYGFIHDSRLPDSLSVQEKKQHAHEMERVKKWLDMLKDPDYERRHEQKWASRIYKGIPQRVRGQAWLRLLRVEQQLQRHPGLYDKLRHEARLWSPDARQIDLDVNRTFRDHTMFRERYGIKQQALFHVLVAYSLYNSELGYCQGMSQIAALLLMFMDEEQAFWALSVLMTGELYRMHGLFIHGFPKLLRLQAHHDKIMKKYLPKLKKHLDKHGIDTSIYTLKWFFQCFLDRVPFPLALRLWDAYLLEGEVVLTAGAYMIMRMHRKTLLRLPMEDILDFLQARLPRDFLYDEDTAIHELTRCMSELRSGKLDRAGQPTDVELPRRPLGLPPRPARAAPAPATANAVPLADADSDSSPTADQASPPPATRVSIRSRPSSPTAPATPVGVIPAPVPPPSPPPASPPPLLRSDGANGVVRPADPLPWSTDGMYRRAEAEQRARRTAGSARHKSAEAGAGDGWAASVERRRRSEGRHSGGGDGGDRRGAAHARHAGVDSVWTPVTPASNGLRRPGHLSLTQLSGDEPGSPPTSPPGTVSIYVSGSGGSGRRSPSGSLGSSSRLSLRWSGSSVTSSLERSGPRSRVSVSPAGATLVTIGPAGTDSPPPARRVRRVPILLEASGVELR
ncbi:USP6 N-terminal-like protein isoform X1 [Amphibalanus amphitrite]|uniref:USP6 N-terminal-like protein isoform X1 n=1 Tax=Amphibalanus amphitrite TaxID=1232801 RepID=UPI001C9039F4|nr:USP6 N-terminal-like protein isoform X1 [Amphibalanus amphitrite]XP_043215797.1 USP6 N-terminal-like protein isoform X1 [Amphibalanus amphitrite]